MGKPDEDDPHDPADESAEQSEHAFHRLIGQELARRGELIPTTIDEVRAAERAGASFEGELPPELSRLRERDDHEARASRAGRDVADAGAPPSRVVVHEPAASHRVVSLQELRRARDRRGLGWSHAVTFGLGVAAAAAFVLFARFEGPGRAQREPGGGPAPSVSTSSSATPRDRIEVPPITTCATGCCAGADCAAAQGELKSCASGRRCMACGDVTSGAYRVRLGNLVPTPLLEGTSLSTLDVCARVAGSDWACFPAFEEPKTSPRARALGQLVAAEDIAAGIELELRPRGQKLVAGRWRSSVRLGPTVLCRGVGAALSNDKGEHFGSLPVLLDDPYFVEIARAADVPTIVARRATLQFADVVPSVVETNAPGDKHFALVAGPFDRDSAERLRWALEGRTTVETTLGEDHVGEARPLP